MALKRNDNNDNNDNKLKQDILINTRICNEDAAKHSQQPVESLGWVCTYKEKAPQSQREEGVWARLE